MGKLQQPLDITRFMWSLWLWMVSVVIMQLPNQLWATSPYSSVWVKNWVFTLFFTGTSEAFLHAVATENSLRRWNDSLLFFSLIYLVLNVCLIRSIGAVGLIIANSLSILLLSFGSTSCFSWFYISMRISVLPWLVMHFYSVWSNCKFVLITNKLSLEAAFPEKPLWCKSPWMCRPEV